MSTPQRAYTILSRVHVNRWDDGLQAVVPGWDLRVRWAATATILPVFIADAYYTPTNVDAAVRNAGQTDDAIHALGG